MGAEFLADGNKKSSSGVVHFTKHCLMSAFFGRTRSRIFGKLMHCSTGSLTRRLFTGLMRIDLSDAAKAPQEFRSCGEIFSRSLRPGARPVELPDRPEALCSPCDGVLAAVGRVNPQNGSARQCIIGPIKGATYDVRAFIGDGQIDFSNKPHFYAVLYLAPQDYHRFHSPTAVQWRIRRHFCGLTLPVFRRFATYCNNLFDVNERVVLSGDWTQGAFHFGAVAAYNVGNIKVHCDPHLRTNAPGSSARVPNLPPDVRLLDAKSAKGDELGMFCLGSTIVLVFEAPADDVEWTAAPGTALRMGQTIAVAGGGSKQ